MTELDDKSIFGQMIVVDKKSYILFGVEVVVNKNVVIEVMLKKTRGTK